MPSGKRTDFISASCRDVQAGSLRSPEKSDRALQILFEHEHEQEQG
jgi:hypothetical protein